MAGRDDREYREYLRKEQRRQPGCLARKVLLIQLIRSTSLGYWLQPDVPEAERDASLGWQP